MRAFDPCVRRGIDGIFRPGGGSPGLDVKKPDVKKLDVEDRASKTGLQRLDFKDGFQGVFGETAG
jgi:hypothetical protein